MSTRVVIPMVGCRVIRGLAVTAAILIAAGERAAADARLYPSRPVSLIVPLAPGSSADQVARLLARKLADQWHQPIVVENRVGAGTIVGTTAVARAPRDGHTLLLAPSGTLAINPTLYKKLPYDAANDFVAIARTTDVPLVLVAAPAVKVGLSDLIAEARRAPGKLVIASSGVGTANHLAAELLQEAAGVSLTHAPYRDASAALRDVAAGHVMLMFADAGASLPLIGNGKLRAIAVSTAARLPIAPDIPPLATLGLPGFEASSWHILLGPNGLPDDVVRKLSMAVQASLAQPDTRRQVELLGLMAVADADPEKTAAFVQAERNRWATVLRRLGLERSQ